MRGMSNGYTDELKLDRTDNNGSYTPLNCRWVTQKVQNNNRRDNVIIEHDGKALTLAEWCDTTGIDRSTFFTRYRKGMTGDKLFAPVRKFNMKKKREKTDRITADTALEIKKDILAGMKNVDIAIKHNVTAGLVSHIKQGNSWRHV